MTRADAAAVLRGESPTLAFGLAWVPTELLDEVAAATGSASGALALASVAASMPVDLAFVDAGMRGVEEAVRALHAAGVAAVWAVDGIFTRVARDVGWSEALRLTAAEPDALTARLDSVLHDALESVRAGVDVGADAVLVGDDLAGAAGPLLSPDYALDALVPCYHRIAGEVATGALPALFHSDGDIRALLPALARAGFSGVHLAGLGDAALSASRSAAHRCGLVVLGGIAAQSLPDRARDAGVQAAHAAVQLGGGVICDDGGIATPEQLAAVRSALAAAREEYNHLLP